MTRRRRHDKDLGTVTWNGTATERLELFSSVPASVSGELGETLAGKQHALVIALARALQIADLELVKILQYLDSNDLYSSSVCGELLTLMQHDETPRGDVGCGFA